MTESARSEPLPTPEPASGLHEAVNSYRKKWLSSLPSTLLERRVLDAARAGHWGLIDSLVRSGEIDLLDLIPALARRRADARILDRVFARLLGLSGRLDRPAIRDLRRMAADDSEPPLARTFALALLERRECEPPDACWVSLLHDARFAREDLDGFPGLALDAYARRLESDSSGERLASILGDPATCELSVRRLCTPLSASDPRLPALIPAVFARWFHEIGPADPLVAQAIAICAERLDLLGHDELVRAAGVAGYAESAARALASWLDPRSIEVFARILLHPPEADTLRASRIRRAAAGGLVRHGSPEALEVLFAGARDPVDGDLRETCRQSLADLREKLRAVDRLRAALERCDPSLKERAAELLRSVEVFQVLPELLNRLSA